MGLLGFARDSCKQYNKQLLYKQTEGQADKQTWKVLLLLFSIILVVSGVDKAIINKPIYECYVQITLYAMSVCTK